MPVDYAVKAVLGRSEWSGNFGPMVSYELQVEGEGAPNSTVELNQKPETPAPTAGQVIYGHIETNSHGSKLKKDQRDQGASNGSSSSGEDQYARRPEHPQNAARMARSKALELAPRYYELFRTENALASNGGDLQATKAKLVQITEWLEGLIDAAYIDAQDQGEKPEPLPAPEPAHAGNTSDADIPFRPTI